MVPPAPSLGARCFKSTRHASLAPPAPSSGAECPRRRNGDLRGLVFCDPMASALEVLVLALTRVSSRLCLPPVRRLGTSNQLGVDEKQFGFKQNRPGQVAEYPCESASLSLGGWVSGLVLVVPVHSPLPCSGAGCYSQQASLASLTSARGLDASGEASVASAPGNVSAISADWFSATW